MIKFRRILRGKIISILNRYKSPKEVFSEIYRNKSWAGAVDSNTEAAFCSGTGSSLIGVVDQYLEDLSIYLNSINMQKFTLLDLGCGDFQVGSRLSEICDTYIGVDVVPELIDYNRKQYSNSRIKFESLDIVSDELPLADVCIVRQVFQHLSNAQIKKALSNLNKYHHIIITEHLPDDDQLMVKNKDKVQGLDIRYYHGSGVYLDAKPFNLPADCLVEVSNMALTHPNTGKRWGRLLTQDYIQQP